MHLSKEDDRLCESAQVSWRDGQATFGYLLWIKWTDMGCGYGLADTR